MSQEKKNSDISSEFSSTSTKETNIILTYVDDINKLNEKIQNSKHKLLYREDEQQEINNEIKKLNLKKNELTIEINNLSANNYIEITNKDKQIKDDNFLLKEISKKLNNCKNILFSIDTSNFNSKLLQKYILSNEFGQFLTDEQIEDIISKSEVKNEFEDLTKKFENEISEKKEQAKILEVERQNNFVKIEEINECLKMMKEEKILINQELVNYMSLNETIDIISKSCLQNMFNKINLSQNKPIDNFHKISLRNNNSKNEEELNNSNIYFNDDNNIYSKKIWNEILTLYNYELSLLDYNLLAKLICTEIFDSFGSKISKAFQNNNEKSKDKKILIKNLRYENNNSNEDDIIVNSQISQKLKNKIISKDVIEFIKKETQKEVKKIFEEFIKGNSHVEKMKEDIGKVITNKLSELGCYIDKDILMKYISCTCKKQYYEIIINTKLKFVNKDYKNAKKNKNKEIEILQQQMNKLDDRIKNIKSKICLEENKLNSISEEKNKKEQKLKLAHDERNYIKLSKKINYYTHEKNKLLKKIEECENSKKLNKYQNELKIKNMTIELNEINDKINNLKSSSINKRFAYNGDVSKYRREILDKFKMIKDNLSIYKARCIPNNKDNYNQFIDMMINQTQNNYYKTLFSLEKIKNCSSPYRDNNMERYNENPNKRTINSYAKNIINKPYTMRIENTKESNYKSKYLNNIYSSTFRNINNKEVKLSNNPINNMFNPKKILLNDYFEKNSIPLSNIEDSKRDENSNSNNNTIFNTLQSISSLKKPLNTKNLFLNKKEIQPNNLLKTIKSYSIDKSNTRAKTITNTSFDEDFNLKSLCPSKNKGSLSKGKNKNKINNLKFISNNLSHANHSVNMSTFFNSLLKRTFCYFRILTNDSPKFNPQMEKNSSEILSLTSDFIKSSINFDKKEDKIKIFSSNKIESIDIKINKIEGIFIDPDMKIIIDIYKEYKDFIDVNPKDDLVEFIQILKKKNKYYKCNLNDEYVKKCCENKKFGFYLKMKNGKLVEFLFGSYEEFKFWNSAISFFIKGKKDLNSELNSLKHFEYP